VAGGYLVLIQMLQMGLLGLVLRQGTVEVVVALRLDQMLE
jgi:hypothetical protein